MRGSWRAARSWSTPAASRADCRPRAAASCTCEPDPGVAGVKIATVVGARPNFMKAAALFAQLRLYGDVRARLVHTGQHYDAQMSEAFFRDLELPVPDVHLGV